jgi:DAACS family dicarboxylate/amino acid:cation (Na+ or H+) symporter
MGRRSLAHWRIPVNSPAMSTTAPRSLPLHTRIFLGFVVGVTVGGGVHVAGVDDVEAVVWATKNLIEPAGRLFLRALLVCVIPLVVSSLVVGVCGLGDLRRLGRIGARTLLLTLLLSTASVLIGLVAANVVAPGEHIDAPTRAALIAEHSGKAKDVASKAVADDKGFGDAVVAVIPDNVMAAMAKSPPDMLGLMLFCLAFGVALALLPEEKKKPVVDVFEGVFAATSTMVGALMKLAPFGVAALLFTMTSRFGFGMLVTLGFYVACVLGALLVHQVVVYGVVLRLGAGMSIVDFLRRAQPALLTAFSTSSSNATLPTALEVAEQRLQVPGPIASFVLTVGATANQNGTALFEGVTVLFLAQVFGVELTLAQQAGLLVMAVVAGIGTAGVPSASLPFVALVLAQVGVPPDALAIVVGVDRFLDMCRTVVNVSGDLVIARVVAAREASATQT